MDEDSNYLSWAGNLYRKFETVFVEAEDMIHQVQMPSGQEASEYLQEKVQGVQQFFTELMEDVLPSSPQGEGGDNEPLSRADLTDHDNSNIAVETDQCSKELTNLSLDEAMEVSHSALSSEPTSNKMCGKLESLIKGIEDDIKAEEIQCKTGCMSSMETRENGCTASGMIPTGGSTSETLNGSYKSELPGARITLEIKKSLDKAKMRKYPSCQKGYKQLEEKSLLQPFPSYTENMKSLDKAKTRKHPSCQKGYKQPEGKSLLQPFPSYTDAFTLYKTSSSSKNVKKRKLPCASHHKDDGSEAGSNPQKENWLHQSFLGIEPQDLDFSDSDWEMV